MRLLDAIGRSVLAITLGAIVVGHVFVVPMLASPSPLLDANLARAIAAPIELRIADVVAFGSVLTACVVPRWTERHVATTLALVAIALAGLDRLLVLPRLHEAWARTDLVAMRPLSHLEAAQTLSTQHYWIVFGIGVCLASVSLLAELARMPTVDQARRKALLAKASESPSRAQTQTQTQTPAHVQGDVVTPAGGQSPAPA